MNYKYEIVGTAAGDQTWTSTGTISVAQLGDFPTVPMLALKDAFMQLTSGKAVYGKPGETCRGPYHIKRLLIERLEN